MRFTAFPIAFATLGLGILVVAALGTLNPLAVVLAAASLLAVLARLVLTLRENAGMLAASRHEALTDALTGLGNRRALTRDLDPRGGCPARRRGAGALRPRRVQALQRLLRPSSRRRAARAPRGQARRRTSPAWGRPTGWAATSSACCCGVDADPVEQAAACADALTEHGDGFTITLLVRRHRRARRGRRRRRGPAHRRPAHVRPQGQRPHLGAQPEPRRPAARALRAQPRARRAHQRRRRAGRGRRAAPGPRRRADRRTSATPPRCTTSARWRSPTRSSTSPARSTTPSGSSSAATRIIGERIVAAAPALRPVAALVRSSHERWDGAGYPDALAGEDDPARRAHRLGLRRLRRDGRRPPLPRRHGRRRRPRRARSAAPARSSTPPWWPRSPRPGPGSRLLRVAA